MFVCNVIVGPVWCGGGTVGHRRGQIHHAPGKP